MDDEYQLKLVLCRFFEDKKSLGQSRCVVHNGGLGTQIGCTGLKYEVS